MAISLGHSHQAVGAAPVTHPPLRRDLASDRTAGHDAPKRRKVVFLEATTAKEAQRGAAVNLTAPKGQAGAPSTK